MSSGPGALNAYVSKVIVGHVQNDILSWALLAEGGQRKLRFSSPNSFVYIFDVWWYGSIYEDSPK